MNKHQSPAPGEANTSGVVGVSWSNHEQRWLAFMKRKGRQLYLGSYRNFEDAVLARKVAERIRRQLSEGDEWWRKWLG